MFVPFFLSGCVCLCIVAWQPTLIQKSRDLGIASGNITLLFFSLSYQADEGMTVTVIVSSFFEILISIYLCVEESGSVKNVV